MQYDSTEKHIVAHGRMSNLVRKHFYCFKTKVYGYISGTADNGFFIAQVCVRVPGIQDLIHYQRVYNIDEVREMIFGTNTNELRAIAEKYDSLSSLAAASSNLVPNWVPHEYPFPQNEQQPTGWRIIGDESEVF